MCRNYFEREAERFKIDAAFFNCPVECSYSPKYFDLNRTKYCETCPNKLERDNLKTETEDLIFQMLGRLDKKFSFEKVLPVVHQISSLKEMSADKMSVKTAEMVGIYQSEKHRADTVKESAKRE